MVPLNLPGVTLACVDTVNPELAVKAMRRCQNGLQFGESILFTNRPVQAPGIETIQVSGIHDIRSYSRFVLKDLGAYINTSHVLLVQWDGFIIHPELWRDEFLNYDYIGATWPASAGHPELVGNGGFSLRSKKLLVALGDIDFADFFPEDEQLARVHRHELECADIHFAPPAVADHFAYEFKGPLTATFGFHGVSNFPDFMTSTELADFIAAMPAGLMFNNYFLEFVRKTIARAQRQPTEMALWHALRHKIARDIEAATPDRLGSRQTKHLISGFCRMKLGALARQLARARLGTEFTPGNLRLLGKALITR